MSKKQEEKITKIKTQYADGTHFTEEETLQAIARGLYIKEQAEHLIDKIKATRFDLQEKTEQELINPVLEYIEDEDGAFARVDYIDEQLKAIYNLAAKLYGLLNPEDESERIVFGDTMLLESSSEQK